MPAYLDVPQEVDQHGRDANGGLGIVDACRVQSAGQRLQRPRGHQPPHTALAERHDRANTCTRTNTHAHPLTRRISTHAGVTGTVHDRRPAGDDTGCRQPQWKCQVPLRRPHA